VPSLLLYAQDPATVATWLQDPVRRAEMPPEPLALALMANLASADPHLRDDLSLTLLEQVLQDPRLTTLARDRLARTATDGRHMFWSIGSRDDDTVFMRSFSVLVVAALVEHDRLAAALPPELLAHLASAVMAYADLEQDWRGYIPHKGWAHAAAHIADALSLIARHPHISPTIAAEILATISRLAMVPSPLAFDEDARLALAAFLIMRERRVPRSTLRAWLGRIVPLAPEDPTGPARAVVRQSNLVHFLQHLYFRWRTHDPHSAWLPAIAHTLARFDQLGAYADPSTDGTP